MSLPCGSINAMPSPFLISWMIIFLRNPVFPVRVSQPIACPEVHGGFVRAIFVDTDRNAICGSLDRRGGLLGKAALELSRGREALCRKVKHRGHFSERERHRDRVVKFAIGKTAQKISQSPAAYIFKFQLVTSRIVVLV